MTQVVKSDKSIEPETYKKILLDISTEDDEAEVVLNQENVDRKMFTLIVEIVYARVKMDLIDKQGVEDLHESCVKKTIEIIEDMPFKKFKPENTRQYLDKTRGRGQ